MTNRNCWFLLLSLLLSALWLPARAEDQGWVLTQRSATFGDQYLYISKNGLKCDNPRAGFAFVTHAPDWTVILYNTKTRVYFQTTIDKWKAEISSRGMGTGMQDKSWAKSGNTSISGLRATEYKMTGSSTLHQSSDNKRTATISNATYWISEDITLPMQVSQLLSVAYGLPTTQHIPLRLQCIEHGKNKELLNTYHSQQSAIPISYFACPSGLTQVKTDAEVMMNDEQKQIMNDMARDLGDSRSSSPSGVTAPSGATGYGAAAPAKTINVGGVNLDRDKVQRLFDAFKKNP